MLLYSKYYEVAIEVAIIEQTELPKRQKRSLFKELPTLGDLLAGVSVALLLIPQALAYAEIAGMPAHTGLYAAAIPAIIAAFFVSSPYLQTGPVALTSLLTFGVLDGLGATPASSDWVAMAALLALIVGLVRVLIGVFNFGGIAYLLSRPVLLGFTTAAALIILSTQIPKAIGFDANHDHKILNALDSLRHIESWNYSTVGLTILTVVIILIGKRMHKLFPGVLLAVVIVTLLAKLLGYTGSTIGDIPEGFPLLNLNLPWQTLPSLLLGGTVIALVGFAEAASIARTYATQDRIAWNANKEFISQGAANLAAGLFGGFPVGGSFSRSSVNRFAGAKTRWSGFITGAAVLAFFPFTQLLADIPKAVLAGIIISAVIGLLKFRELAELAQFSRPQAYIGWITFILTLVMSNQVEVAVLLGIGLAIAHHLRREQQIVCEINRVDDTVTIAPHGVLWFGSAFDFERRFNDMLEAEEDITNVIVDLEALGRIDMSAAIVVKRLIDQCSSQGIECDLIHVPPMATSWMNRVWKMEIEE